MKSFKFRLETVLKIRGIERDQQARALALAQREALQIRDEILEMKRRLIEELQRIKRLSGEGNFTEQILRLSGDYREDLKRKIEKRTQDLNQAAARIEKEREKLIERQKARKAMEKLEEKDRENYELEQRINERKEVDELVTLRWPRFESQ
jgi:flagellar FliJ protein